MKITDETGQEKDEVDDIEVIEEAAEGCTGLNTNGAGERLCKSASILTDCSHSIWQV